MNCVNIQVNKNFIDILNCSLLEELIHRKRMIINKLGNKKENIKVIKEIKEIIKKNELLKEN